VKDTSSTSEGEIADHWRRTLAITTIDTPSHGRCGTCPPGWGIRTVKSRSTRRAESRLRTSVYAPPPGDAQLTTCIAGYQHRDRAGVPCPDRQLTSVSEIGRSGTPTAAASPWAGAAGRADRRIMNDLAVAGVLAACARASVSCPTIRPADVGSPLAAPAGFAGGAGPRADGDGPHD
jgi:hypothetical protein